MKKLSIFSFVLFTSLCFLSCSKDDDKPAQHEELTDQLFFETAISNFNLELAAATLTSRNTETGAIRELGTKMAQANMAHKKAALAAAQLVSVNVDEHFLNSVDKAALGLLSNVANKAFELAYIETVYMAHKNIVSLYEQAADPHHTGTGASTKDYARKAVVALKQQLDAVETIKKQALNQKSSHI